MDITDYMVEVSSRDFAESRQLIYSDLNNADIIICLLNRLLRFLCFRQKQAQCANAV